MVRASVLSDGLLVSRTISGSARETCSASRRASGGRRAFDRLAADLAAELFPGQAEQAVEVFLAVDHIDA
jgi:hypothetical protein